MLFGNINLSLSVQTLKQVHLCLYIYLYIYIYISQSIVFETTGGVVVDREVCFSRCVKNEADLMTEDSPTFTNLKIKA